MSKTRLLFVFGDLGDTILTVPAVRALRTSFPDDRLLLLAKPAAGEFVARLGLVDEVVPVDKHIFDRPGSLLRPAVMLNLLRLWMRLRREKIDDAVIFHHLVTRWGAIKFALLAFASGARRRYGIDNGRGWFLTDRVVDRGFGARHEAQYFLDVSRLAGAVGNLHLQAPVSHDDRMAASRLLGAARLGAPFVAIHPGTGWYGPGRVWPPAGFAAAFGAIQRARDVTPVVVGTEEDRRVAEPLIAALGPRAVDLVNKTSVGTLAAVLERCSLLIANDGGVGHLASAVDTPVVSVFGPSNDRAWRPLTATVVAHDLPCRPCFYRDFERGHPAGCPDRECMKLVTPTRVAEAALAILENEPLVL